VKSRLASAVGWRKNPACVDEAVVCRSRVSRVLSRTLGACPRPGSNRAAILAHPAREGPRLAKMSSQVRHRDQVAELTGARARAEATPIQRDGAPSKLLGTIRSEVAVYVMSPAFSIAPNVVDSVASMSLFSYGTASRNITSR